MIPEGQYLFGLAVLLLLGVIIGVLVSPITERVTKVQHIWSPAAVVSAPVTEKMAMSEHEPVIVQGFDNYYELWKDQLNNFRNDFNRAGAELGSIADELKLIRVALVDELPRIGDELRMIRLALQETPPKPGHMKLQWGTPVDDAIPIPQPTSPIREENSMPGKETDSQTVACTEVETDAAGNPVVLNPANVVWAIDDATIASLTQNADGSATFKAVKPVPPAVNPRVANVTCTDTVTKAVGADTLEVDDSATQPGKMVLTFGTPA